MELENEENYLIPKTLDDPPMVLLWDLDVAAAFVVPFMFGLTFNLLIPGLILGIVAKNSMGKLKELGGPRVLLQAAYWYLPSNWIFDFKATPESHIRDMAG